MVPPGPRIPVIRKIGLAHSDDEKDRKGHRQSAEGQRGERPGVGLKHRGRRRRTAPLSEDQNRDKNPGYGRTGPPEVDISSRDSSTMLAYVFAVAKAVFCASVFGCKVAIIHRASVRVEGRSIAEHMTIVSKGSIATQRASSQQLHLRADSGPSAIRDAMARMRKDRSFTDRLANW